MNQQALKQIISSLAQDSELLAQLGTLLQQQYVLMSERKSTELTQLNQQATALLTQLQHNASLRTAAMQQLQQPLTAQGLDNLLAQLPERIRLGSQQLLQKVQHHSSLCQQLNAKNGELLAYQRRLMQKLLGLPNKTQYPQLQLSR
jgi:flagella synthesis protein FlgN